MELRREEQQRNEEPTSKEAPIATEKNPETINENAENSNSHPLGWCLEPVSSCMNKMLPLLVICMAGYTIYVYCYVYCWNEVINFHSRETGIIFIAVFSVFLALLVITWCQILMVGPGRVARTPQSIFLPSVQQPQGQLLQPDSRLAVLPKVFVCDPHGYPLWCSTCQSVKLDRVHHSAELQRCVPKMDHLCNWVGGVIGETNYKAFLQFIFYFEVLLLFSVVTLAIFAHKYYVRTGTAAAHLIIVFALAGMWFLLLIGFLLVHVRYTLHNITTIEHLKHNKGDFPIFNFETSDGLRVVSRRRRGDPWPYDVGKYNNWKQIMGPTIFHWLLPLPVTKKTQSKTYDTASSSSPNTEQVVLFNPELLAIFQRRYTDKEEGYLAYPHLQLLPSENNFVTPPATQNRGYTGFARYSPQISEV